MSTYLCVRCNAGVLRLRADVTASECESILSHPAPTLEERLLLTSADLFGEAPLCEVCMQTGISEVSRHVEQLRWELQQARQTLGELGTSEDPADLEQELSDLVSNYSALESRESRLRARLTELETEDRKLRETSDAVFERWLEVQERAVESEISSLAVDRKIKNLRTDLKTLKRLNVVDAIFKISCDHDVASINGLRLGNNKTEINAALGQIALLIQFVQNKSTNYTSNFRVFPKGSLSYLSESTNIFELYLTSENRFFGSRKFDLAMQALLAVVQELLMHCLRGNRALRIPYKIALPDKIANVSVNLQFHGQGQWTQAMKFLLTNLKFLLLHINTLDSLLYFVLSKLLQLYSIYYYTSLFTTTVLLYLLLH